eukprot:TRINITY_DN3987_c0_g1_i1.p2 TRINITY_DN3987_c0_g1~~TRINITY_DN3987_c0_g1_i1.p2  ORF type:complete len:256 (-),score=178.73 TRINITY_DN3987_c0_g1_i1:31-798(-)
MSNTKIKLSRDEIEQLRDAHPDYLRDVLGSRQVRDRKADRERAALLHWHAQRRSLLSGALLLLSLWSADAAVVALGTLLLSCVLLRADSVLLRVTAAALVASVGGVWQTRWLVRQRVVDGAVSSVLPPFAAAVVDGYVQTALSLVVAAFAMRGVRHGGSFGVAVRAAAGGALVGIVNAHAHARLPLLANTRFAVAYGNALHALAWFVIGCASLWLEGAAANTRHALDTLIIGLVWSIVVFLPLWAAARFAFFLIE